MKKTGYYIFLGFLAFLWIYALSYGLKGHWISLIICAFILVPPTLKCVFGLLSASAGEHSENDALADKFVPIVQSPAAEQPVQNEVSFCRACGNKIQLGAAFCSKCGTATTQNTQE